jgi:hypothetical protein
MASDRLFQMLAEAKSQPDRWARAVNAGAGAAQNILGGYIGGLQAKNEIGALKNAPQVGADERQMKFLDNFGKLSEQVGRKNAIQYMGPMAQRYGIDLAKLNPSTPATTATAMLDTSAPQIASSSMNPNIDDSDTMNAPIIRRQSDQPGSSISSVASPSSAPDYQGQLKSLVQSYQNGEIGNKEYQRSLEAIRTGSRMIPSTDPVMTGEDALKAGTVQRGTRIVNPLGQGVGGGKTFVGNDSQGRPLFADKAGNISLGNVPGGGPVMPKSSTMPTSSTRGSAEFASALVPHVQQMRNLIQQADAKGYIGPVAGRVYGDFLAGKVGTTGNPDADALLGNLRTTDSLIKSGMLRTHFGARGGQQMYQNFSNMLNSGKQTAAMMNGSLDSMSSFLKGYAQAGNTGQIQSDGNPNVDSGVPGQSSDPLGLFK